MEVGDILEVTVVGVQHFGLFVEADEISGLILIPEISWHAISHPSEVAKKGDRIQCKIVAITPEKPGEAPRFSGSIKALSPEKNPWRDPSVYRVGSEFSGIVSRERTYGVFIRHPNGADALLHRNDIPEGATFAKDDVVSVKIVRCNVEDEKLRVELTEASD